VATCLEFGPRFLQSTGQAYDGGPNTDLFLQITCDDAIDLPLLGRKYSFGAIKAAQARGGSRSGAAGSPDFACSYFRGPYDRPEHTSGGLVASLQS
jgi:hypothetical protein